MCFSFSRDGPEFIGEFPVCLSHFALFSHFNYFKPVANNFLFYFIFCGISALCSAADAVQPCTI